MFRSTVVLSLVAVLCLAGCGKPPAEKPVASSAASTNRQVFEVNGVITELMPKEKSVRIKHHEVPGYMPAMTMPFDVKDTNELAGLEVGDPVSFRLTVTDTDGWIDQIRKTGPKTNDLPTTGPFRRVRDVEPLNIGDVLPEYYFTNQFGRPFSTAQFKGQALAINFLFTRCPYPAFCPKMANNFAEAQQKLLAMPGGPTNWQLLTISFDPDFDTPAILKAYAENHRYDPARWTFATGPLIDITAIADQLGLAFWHDESGGITHTLRTAVIDPSGRVQKIWKGNEWPVDELVSEIAKAAAVK